MIWIDLAFSFLHVSSSVPISRTFEYLLENNSHWMWFKHMWIYWNTLEHTHVLECFGCFGGIWRVRSFSGAYGWSTGCSGEGALAACGSLLVIFFKGPFQQMIGIVWKCTEICFEEDTPWSVSILIDLVPYALQIDMQPPVVFLLCIPGRSSLLGHSGAVHRWVSRWELVWLGLQGSFVVEFTFCLALLGSVYKHDCGGGAMVVAWDRSHVEPWYLMSHLMAKKGEVQIWAKKCTKEQFWITTLVKKNQPCKTLCFCMISAMSWPEGSKRQAPGDMYKVF